MPVGNDLHRHIIPKICRFDDPQMPVAQLSGDGRSCAVQVGHQTATGIHRRCKLFIGGIAVPYRGQNALLHQKCAKFPFRISFRGIGPPGNLVGIFLHKVYIILFHRSSDVLAVLCAALLYRQVWPLHMGAGNAAFQLRCFPGSGNVRQRLLHIPNGRCRDRGTNGGGSMAQMGMTCRQHSFGAAPREGEATRSVRMDIHKARSEDAARVVIHSFAGQLFLRYSADPLPFYVHKAIQQPVFQHDPVTF